MRPWAEWTAKAALAAVGFAAVGGGLSGVSLAVLGFANSECEGGAFVNPPPPVCTGDHCTPPACQGHCTPPGNNTRRPAAPRRAALR